MYPADKFDHLRRFYNSDGDILFNGLWSILITPSAEHSAEFAARHFCNFNEVSRGQWHLGVCARPERASGNNARTDVEWFKDNKRQKISDVIRLELKNAGIELPDMCAVFFDPNTSRFYRNGFIGSGLPEDNYSETIAYLPLDGSKIADANLYKAGFKKTHEEIVKAIEIYHGNAYGKISPEIYSSVLIELDSRLRPFGFKSFAKKIGVVTLSAIWGNYLGGKINF